VSACVMWNVRGTHGTVLPSHLARSRMTRRVQVTLFGVARHLACQATIVVFLPHVSRPPWKVIVRRAPLRRAVGIRCSISPVQADQRAACGLKPGWPRPTRCGRTELPSRQRSSADGSRSP